MARAQQAAMPVIGFLGIDSLGRSASRLQGFIQGLREAGYVEGVNVAFEYRWANDHNEQLPALANDLVQSRVAVIVTLGSSLAALAAKAATTAIPIVFAIGADPVSIGLVAHLNRPGGNITGVAVQGVDLLPKQLELLHESVPGAKTFAVLINSASPVLAEAALNELRSASDLLGLELRVLDASSELEFDTIFARVSRLGVGGLVIANDVLFSSRAAQLGALTARHGAPAIYQLKEFVVGGGLMSYGPGSDLAGAFRVAGLYVGRILKGEKPADLPIDRFAKIQLMINLKTAKALGLTLPQSILLRADEVIE
jgi:putative ABC transport system substrate-binding protein